MKSRYVKMSLKIPGGLLDFIRDQVPKTRENAKNYHGDPLAWLEDEIAYSIPGMICSELSIIPKEFAEGPPYDMDHSKLRAKYGLPH